MSNLSPESLERRYDVDWVRIIALILLIIYHAVIAFQFWAHELIFFLENETPLPQLWLGMSLINIWRIPLLFLVSGLATYYALRRRTLSQLVGDRTWRILFPALIGLFLICPLNLLIVQSYYKYDLLWIPNPGHLWFLFNIFAYILILLPIFYWMQKIPDNWILKTTRTLFKQPATLLLLTLPFAAQAILLDPTHYSAFFLNLHGFTIGLIAFFMGFLLAATGPVFWHSVEKFRHSALCIALSLYGIRLLYYRLENIPNILQGIESILWILAVLGYASKHLNQNSSALKILSPAVYPIYILHLPVQFVLSTYLFPLQIHPLFKLILLIAGTFTTCWILYRFLRAIPILRPALGMPFRNKRKT